MVPLDVRPPANRWASRATHRQAAGTWRKGDCFATAGVRQGYRRNRSRSTARPVPTLSIRPPQARHRASVCVVGRQPGCLTARLLRYSAKPARIAALLAAVRKKHTQDRCKPAVPVLKPACPPRAARVGRREAARLRSPSEALLARRDSWPASKACPRRHHIKLRSAIRPDGVVPFSEVLALSSTTLVS